MRFMTNIRAGIERTWRLRYLRPLLQRPFQPLQALLLMTAFGCQRSVPLQNPSTSTSASPELRVGSVVLDRVFDGFGRYKARMERAAEDERLRAWQRVSPEEFSFASRKELTETMWACYTEIR